MALFGKKKTEKKEDKKAVKTAAKTHTVSLESARAIVRPHITEKTGALSAAGVYTFEVVRAASSREIALAVEALYKVVPVRVSVAPIRTKKKNFRGIPGKTPGGKKAYVSLKKGDTIEFI